MRRTYDRRRAYWKAYYADPNNKRHLAEYGAAWHAANRDRRNVDARENYWRMRVENPIALMLMRSRSRAKRVGLQHTLRPSDIVIPDVCPVLGIPIEMGKHRKGPSPNSPSIDRIDSRLGYVPGNVRVISHRANTLKCDATIAELELVLADLRKLRDEASASAAEPCRVVG